MKKSDLRKLLEKEHNNNLILAEAIVEYENRFARIVDSFVTIFGSDDNPSVESVILSGPATVVLWDDGTKTVTKLREGDEWDPLFGILACIVRKLTRNRGHAVNDSEELLHAIAADVQCIEDVDALIDYGQFVLDVLEVLRDAAPLWMMMLGPDDEQTEAEDVDEPQPMSAEEAVRERERTRQTIRDLVDRGEL